MQVRTLTSQDKILIAAALLNVGVKARVRKFPGALRVCFVGNQADVLEVLNSNGFRNACGEQFTRHSFNQPHEIFVHRMAA